MAAGMVKKRANARTPVKLKRTDKISASPK